MFADYLLRFTSQSMTNLNRIRKLYLRPLDHRLQTPFWFSVERLSFAVVVAFTMTSKQISFSEKPVWVSPKAMMSRSSVANSLNISSIARRPSLSHVSDNLATVVRYVVLRSLEGKHALFETMLKRTAYRSSYWLSCTELDFKWALTVLCRYIHI